MTACSAEACPKGQIEPQGHGTAPRFMWGSGPMPTQPSRTEGQNLESKKEGRIFSMADPVNNAAKTRGRKFERGNPGRPRGARNKRSVLVEQLMDADISEIVKSVLDKAKQGDLVAAKLVLDRVAPIPKGRALALNLPAVSDGDSVLRCHASLLAALADGVISADEAEGVGRVLSGYLKAVDSVEIERRLTQLEALVAKPLPSEMRQ